MSRRGWEYFIMSLARELKMTKRQLLNNLDSVELTEWLAYFKEENKPATKRQSKEEIEGALKTAFAGRVKKGKHK